MLYMSRIRGNVIFNIILYVIKDNIMCSATMTES